jgi:hypothetical protein
MRQTRLCAWLLVTSAAFAACGGAKFTSNEPNATANDGPAAGYTAGTSNRNHAGSTSSSGGSIELSGAGKSPGGGASSAGSSSAGSASGGTGGTGSGDSAGAGGDACPSGSITFRMLPSPDLAHDYLCDAGCGTGWLTITDAQGATAFSISSACGTASCESCEVQPCTAAACLPMPLTANGSEQVWTGTYLAKDTCGANMACQKQACVKPGKYKAKACAAVNAGSSSMGSGCMPKNEQLCAEAEFDFPATATVKLVLKKP